MQVFFTHLDIKRLKQEFIGALYCSDECRREDISYSIKLTTSPTYSFYSKPISPPLSPTFNYRYTKATKIISAAILDEPQSQDSSYQSSDDENVITSKYTKIHPWINQRRQQRRLSIII
ncbi:19665_t:CDS:2 [Rhizophagus irregularis]|nr:19665_t:CDS:2 [Rhizophagus irregularis]